MRRRRSDSQGSLDSLLDTMTNVVGILVILLVVTQLGVRDAVNRISETDQVNPAELAAAEEHAASVLAQRQELEEQLAARTTSDPAVTAQQLVQLERQLKQQQSINRDVREVLQAELAQRQAKIEELSAASQDKLAEFQSEKKKLEEQFAANADAIASLRARLESTPTAKPLPAKVVHLPNPRPAPKDAQPLTFICRGGKLYFVNIEAHQNRAVRWTNAEVQRRRLNANPKQGIDCGPLFASFNREGFRDRDIELLLEIRGRLPYLVLKRREHGGETTKEIREARSYYQRGLKQISPDQFYLQFLVWNDSFETYLEARRIAEEHGMLAGWQPMTTTDEYKVRLASNLRHGPPPPPKPKPDPPDKPDPKPQPPPRPVPMDVID